MGYYALLVPAGVAARARHLGVGEIIPVRQLTVPQLRQAVETVLGSTTYRESAQRCAREIRERDGPAQAAALIEQAFTTRKPVCRQSATTERLPLPRANGYLAGRSTHA
jgi:hypothetical protein